jgi:hypothetical protein
MHCICIYILCSSTVCVWWGGGGGAGGIKVNNKQNSKQMPSVIELCYLFYGIMEKLHQGHIFPKWLVLVGNRTRASAVGGEDSSSIEIFEQYINSL